MSHTQAKSRGEGGGSPVDDADELSFPAGDLENLTELGAPAPLEDPDEAPSAHREYLEDREAQNQEQNALNHRESYQRRDDSVRTLHGINNNPGSPSRHHNPLPSETATMGNCGMDEVESGGEHVQEYAASPRLANVTDTISADIVENPEDTRFFSHHNLDEGSSQVSSSASASQEEKPAPVPESVTAKRRRVRIRIKTQIFIFAHLIFFSILGTLARLGLAVLTTYPTSISFAHSLWPNFTGSLILGFLSESSELLHHPRTARSITRASPDAARTTRKTRHPGDTEERAGGPAEKVREGLVAKAPAREILEPIPLYIGLTSGFCGSFTTFSTFMLDCFKALSGIATPESGPSPPSPGRNFMAVAGVLLITVGLSAAGLRAGAHMAVFVNGFERCLPRRLVYWLDYASLVLGLGAWIVIIVLAILGPDLAQVGVAGWQMVLALSLAPLGCLLRFALSLRMNSLAVSFPLGTFAANAFGSLVLAVAWDLQRLPAAGGAESRMLGGFVSCQVLQGVEDGFCGCATTVSTWILELTALKRRHAYRYGLATLAAGLGIFVVVSGSLQWTVGLAQPVCTTI
ncbi:CrcB-like protein-domain-containing protein [Xylaria cubensis]|nr:CrcB-like protein-domain-containing protein [Xylaria cubensis]